MKTKCFFYVFFGMLAFSANAQSNWKLVGQDDFTKTYIDLGSVKENLGPQSSVVVDLVMVTDNFKRPEDLSNTNISYAASRSTLISISCQYENWRILNNKFYNKHYGVGQHFDAVGPFPWNHSSKGDSSVKAVYKAVCG